jgi:hypothetical protein
MIIELTNVDRRLPWPVWSMLVVGLWLTLVGAAVFLSRKLGIPVELCMFKSITGIPCLTCGTTRGVLLFLGGEPLKAWLSNPLVFTALPLFTLILIMRIVLGKRLCIALPGRWKMLAWILAATAVAANWAYVILFVG